MRFRDRHRPRRRRYSAGVLILTIMAVLLAACAPAAPAAKPTEAPKPAVAAPAAAPASPAAAAAAPAAASPAAAAAGSPVASAASPGAQSAAAPAAAGAPKPQISANAAAKPGGALVVGLEGEPAAIDPAGSGNLGSQRITRQINETLIKEDTRVTDQPTAPIIPGLAERWEISPDGKVWTFFLRKGVKFTDGTDFNADAVKANLDRLMNKESKLYWDTAAAVASGTTTLIDSYTVVDPATFKITLKAPFGSFDRALMHPRMGIISPAALEKFGNDGIGANVVGTGPFKYKERERGVKIVLEKNPDYWDKNNPPYLDQVIFRVMPDSASRASALKTGEIDVDVMVLPDFVEDLRKEPSVEVALASNAHIWYLVVNHRDPLMQKPQLRQAIWQAIDREGMAKSLLLGTGRGAWQFLPPKNPAHRADLANKYAYDPEKAKALLAQAGVAPGTKITLVHPNEGSSYMRPREMSQFIQANLKAIGLDLQLDGLEWAAFTALGGGKPVDEKYQLSVSAWQSISHDPFMLEQLWGCDFRVPKGPNSGMACNEEADKVLVQARQEPDAAKRIALYQKAEDMMIDFVPGIPVANDFSPRGVRKNVKGLVMGPSTFFDLYGTWLEK